MWKLPDGFTRSIHWDVETFCEESVTEIGADAYSRHPTFEVLMAAYTIDDGPMQQWIPVEGQPMPVDLEDALRDPQCLKYAWNKNFEWSVLENHLHIHTEHREWRDPMVLGYTLSFPGKLEKVGPLVGLPEDKRKDARGKALIRKFCGLQKPNKTHPKPWRIWPYMAPKEWEEFLSYNRQDVVAEQAIWRRIRKYDMPAHEWENWFMDQEINQDGIPVNGRLVQNAIRVYESLLEDRFRKMRAITGLTNPNSQKEILAWLKKNGYPYDDVQKGHIRRALDFFTEPPKTWSLDKQVAYGQNKDLKRVLELRLESAKSSPKKYGTLLRHMDVEAGVIRNVFQFYGAGRSGRWSGRAWQAQNLAKPTKELEKILPAVVRHLEFLDAEALEMIYEKPFDVLSSCVRPVVQAPEGFVFADVDLSAIENRVLGWMSNCHPILDVFKKGQDPYIAFATKLFHKTYEELWHEYKVLGNSSKRTIAKPGVLGCLAEGTLVLTDRGYVPIESVSVSDRVHDGDSFVTHGGTVRQGVKGVVECGSVFLTPDHLILSEDGWKRADQTGEKRFRLARSLARGKLCRSVGWKGRICTLKRDALVGRLRKFMLGTFDTERRTAVSVVPFAPGEGLSGGRLEPRLTTVLPTDFMQYVLDAKTRRIQNIQVTEEEESGVCFLMQILLLIMLSAFSKLRKSLRLIESIMTGTTKKEISERRIEASKQETRESATGLNIVEECIRRRSFAECLRQNIGILLRLPEKRIKEKQQSKSSQNRRIVAERMTYDIVNAGPNLRFLVWSEGGPILVHNCGYRLGPGEQHENRKTGEMEATGLLGYAWNMGVRQFTKEDSALSVDTFRRAYPEVVEFWYAIERAAKKCITTGREVDCWPVVLDMAGPFMRMRLPSGRCLHYFRPRIKDCKTPWGEVRPTVTYEGLNDKKAWGLITTHGGKLTENCWNSDTLILTGSGVKSITEVTEDDLVWDGVSWVKHGGVVYSGERETIDFAGAKVTPEHRIETDGGWKRVYEISPDEAASAFDRHYGRETRKAVCCSSSWFGQEENNLVVSLRLRFGGCDGGIRVSERADKVLRVFETRRDCKEGEDTRHDKTPGVCRVEVDVSALSKSEAQSVSQLWGSWYRRLFSLGGVREVLGGYARGVFNRVVHRTGEQQQGIFQEKLCVGGSKSAKQEYSVQSHNKYTERMDDDSRSIRAIEDWENNPSLSEQRRVSEGTDVRSTGCVEPVYDILKCGKRAAFTVVLPDGRLVLSHNCDQAASRDLLVHGMRLAKKEGLSVRVHVHDQIIALVPEKEADRQLQILKDCMQDVPAWAKGLPLGSSGFISKIFTKD